MFGKNDMSWNGMKNDYVGADKYVNDIQSVKFANKSNNEDPKYAYSGDSGFDLRAWVTEDEKDVKIDKDEKPYVVIKSFERRLIHTGIYVELPINTEIQVRTRSGCALKSGLVVLNSPGTIDNLYRGEICVIIYNTSKTPVNITNGDRIAQAVLVPVYPKELVNLVKVDEINTNAVRADNGFGSSGIK